MSEPDPWTADRELTQTIASAAIKEAVPELAEATVKRLGNGWDFDTYLAESRWVFRFPRRKQVQAALHKDLALLPWLVDRVDLAVPRYHWGPLRAPSFPYEFSGYELLAGEMAVNVEPEPALVSQLGERLGVFFRELHALQPPAELITAADLDRPLIDPGPLRPHMRRYLPKFVRDVPQLADRATRFFDDPDLAPTAYTGPPRLIHADLHAEHLLLNPNDLKEISGLIDWSDARVGDPAREFACLYSWGGETMLLSMCGAYASDDPTLESRSRFLGTCYAFMDWSWWMEVNRTVAARAAVQTLEGVLPQA